MLTLVVVTDSDDVSPVSAEITGAPAVRRGGVGGAIGRSKSSDSPPCEMNPLRDNFVSLFTEVFLI